MGKSPLGRRHLVSMFHIVCTVLNPIARRFNQISPPIIVDLYLVLALFDLEEMGDWEVFRMWHRDNKQIKPLVRGQDNASAVASAVQETTDTSNATNTNKQPPSRSCSFGLPCWGTSGASLAETFCRQVVATHPSGHQLCKTASSLDLCRKTSKSPNNAFIIVRVFM